MAKTLYVNKDHGSASDSTTYANNSASLPWLTINRALWGNTNRNGAPTTGEAAAAGDTVKVVKATTPYTFATSLSNVASLVPCNTGSPGNPIIIEADGLSGDFGEDWVELDAEVGSGGDVFGGWNDVNHPDNVDMGWFEWRGFLIDETNQDRTGSWPCYFLGCRDILVEYCKFIGDGVTTSRGDNHNATRFQHCFNYHVKNCHVEGFYSGGGSEENGNAFECYWSGGGIFEHNYVTDCGMGWFAKAPNHEQASHTNVWGAIAPHVCRFNHFHDCEQGISPHRLDNTTEANGFYIYQNLLTQIRGTPVRFKVFNTDTFSPHHVKFFNNTIWSDEAGQPEFEVFADDNAAFQGDNEAICKNNIIKLAISIEGFHSAGAASVFSDLNTYHSNRNCWDIATATSGNFFVGGTNVSYANWQATHGQDADSGSGRTTVTFVSAGTDFRLTSNGQAALTLGRSLYDIGGATGATIPCGCYISGTEVIGIEPFDGEGGGSDGTGHKAPSGMLRRRRRVM